ncbi:hypothetical protein [Streptomyces sp. NPDC002758]
MSADDLMARIMSWTSEDSHRGRLARAFKSNMGDSAELQAKRLGLLSIHMEREAHRKRGLALI